MKIKIGIFFGGPSREREISFAGGRTVCDYLDQTIFEPIPLFIDSQRNFILLDRPWLYQEKISDFYPPEEVWPPALQGFDIHLESIGSMDAVRMEELISKVGRRIAPEELPQLISIAFLALHGDYGADGQLQSLLQQLRIPYTGNGIDASRLGNNKAMLRAQLEELGFQQPPGMILKRRDWLNGEASSIFGQAAATTGFPIVVRPARQGSSIGVSIVEEKAGLEGFIQSVNRAFFREVIPVSEWVDRNEYERLEYLHLLSDLRDGLGYPLDITIHDATSTIDHPEALLHFLNEHSVTAQDEDRFVLEAHQGELEVILEAFIEGREFSCIVLRREDDSVFGLPPTGILKAKDIYDYNAKYQPGLSKRVMPVDLPEAQVLAIRASCEKMFQKMGFQAFARIDGFITSKDRIIINDPNTTTAFLPSSMIFLQAATIGLSPSQLLTYLIRVSLQERIAEQPKEASFQSLLRLLNEKILLSRKKQRKRVGLVFGGHPLHRQASHSSALQVFEQLSASEDFEPVPFYLDYRSDDDYDFYQLPVYLLLQNDDDPVQDQLTEYYHHPAVEQIISQGRAITVKFSSGYYHFASKKVAIDDLPQLVDVVFIALHGRPGTDGQLQRALKARNIPFSGPDEASARITVDKYRTGQLLSSNDISVPAQLMISQAEYLSDSEECCARIEDRFGYPLIAKPADEEGRLGVLKIHSREELKAYIQLLFRPKTQEGRELRRFLRIKAGTPIPVKQEILIEKWVGVKEGEKLLEISCGLFAHIDAPGNIRYEIFDPSEICAHKEELFLPNGHHRTITPARFAAEMAENERISNKVKGQLEKAARILRLKAYALIDAFVKIHQNGEVEVIVIEVNSLPELAPTTGILKQAARSGYSPLKFMENMLVSGFRPQHPQPEKTVAPILEKKADKTSEPVEQPEKEEDYFPPTTTEKIHFTKPMNYSNPTDEKTESAFMTFVRKIGQEVWQFLRSPSFLKNFGALAAVLLVCYLFLSWWLHIYTNHGESFQVPNFIGMDLDDVVKKARSRSFDIVVIDSIFDPNQNPYEVYQQDPEPLSRVKENRSIYLSVYRNTPPMITLPSLVGNYDFYQYQKKLKSLKIEAKVRERKFNSKLEENTILYFFHQGEKITDADLRKGNGVEVPQGSTLEFVITERNTGMVPIPDLVCKNYQAASFLISSMNLTMGAVQGDVFDQDRAYVWKQEPAYEAGSMIRIGTQIDIYLRETRPAGCPEEETPSELEEEGTDGFQ